MSFRALLLASVSLLAIGRDRDADAYLLAAHRARGRAAVWGRDGRLRVLGA